MTTKHTPGPWKAEWGTRSYGYADWQVLDSKETELLINIPNGPEAEANAHLIAASPELLEALQMAFPYIHDLQKDNFDEPGAGIFLDRDLETAFSKIQLAIAKATGEKEAV